jgi:hypothetical protein
LHRLTTFLGFEPKCSLFFDQNSLQGRRHALSAAEFSGRLFELGSAGVEKP